MARPASNDALTLTFETLLTDPLVRLVMERDGVTVSDLLSVLEKARAAVVAREAEAVERALDD